jgi:hypothetical protein
VGEGEEAASLHRRFDAQRLLPKKAARMGDEGKAVGSVLRTALLFLPRDSGVALFCLEYGRLLARHHTGHLRAHTHKGAQRGRSLQSRARSLRQRRREVGR